MHPVTISHGFKATKPGRAKFRLEFDWTGTSDPTAWMSVPKAIDYVGSLMPGGWPAIMARNRELALDARRMLCAVAGTPPACPDEMVGSLASIRLPDGLTTDVGWRRPDPLQQRLFDGWGIEVPINSWPVAPRRQVRISAALHNGRDQYVRLAEALEKELALERMHH